MKKINTFAVLILILGSLKIFSQNIDTSNFFPYKTGDMWEYFFDAGGPDVDTVQTITTTDSTDADGYIHITQTSRHINPIHSIHTDNYIIDTINNYVYGYSSYGPENDYFLLYKSNAQQGEQWVIYEYEIGGYEMARVERVYEDTFFGINTIVKGFFYYASGDSTDTTGLARGYNELAGGFGLSFHFGSEGGGDLYLIGAVINGVLYGDTTKIITSVFDIESNVPEQIHLYPNYPNPFNPITTIEYNLERGSNVTLIIYNLLGEEVTKLVEEYQSAGYYKVNFNARDLSSGVYIYSIKAGEYFSSKKMILAK